MQLTNSIDILRIIQEIIIKASKKITIFTSQNDRQKLRELKHHTIIILLYKNIIVL